MYRRAYGGPAEMGAISGVSAIPRFMPEPAIRSDDDDFDYDDDPDLSPTQIGLAVTTFEVRKASPKGPALKIQTNFEAGLRSKWDYTDDGENEPGEKDGDEDSDRTARPLERLPVGFTPWSASIDYVLSAGVVSPDRGSMRQGPMTPNGYDDISPITRGEWGFLMVDDAFQGGRTVAVETC